MTRSARSRAMLAEMGIFLGPERASVAEPFATPPRESVASDPVSAPVPAPAPPPPAATLASAAVPPASAASQALVRHASHAAQLTEDAWATWEQQVKNCNACGLCDTRSQVVVGAGSPKARVLVVGEAPGEQEDLQGEPFVGAAGQLLDRMLAAVGWGRAPSPESRPSQGWEPVYITNTIKCRPPQNRNPQPAELQACAPHLMQQLAWVQPVVVLALGRFAAQQILGSESAIGRLRGQVHRWKHNPSVQVVVSYHPAYLLRNPADKGKAWADLCLAAELLEQSTAVA